MHSNVKAKQKIDSTYRHSSKTNRTEVTHHKKKRLRLSDINKELGVKRTPLAYLGQDLRPTYLSRNGESKNISNSYKDLLIGKEFFFSTYIKGIPNIYKLDLSKVEATDDKKFPIDQAKPLIPEINKISTFDFVDNKLFLGQRNGNLLLFNLLDPLNSSNISEHKGEITAIKSLDSIFICAGKDFVISKWNLSGDKIQSFDYANFYLEKVFRNHKWKSKEDFINYSSMRMTINRIFNVEDRIFTLNTYNNPTGANPSNINEINIKNLEESTLLFSTINHNVLAINPNSIHDSDQNDLPRKEIHKIGVAYLKTYEYKSNIMYGFSPKSMAIDKKNLRIAFGREKFIKNPSSYVKNGVTHIVAHPGGKTKYLIDIYNKSLNLIKRLNVSQLLEHLFGWSGELASVYYTQNGNLIFSDTEGNVYSYGDKEVKKLYSHTTSIREYKSDKDKLITLSEDGTVVVYDLINNKTICSIIITNSGVFILNPDGYYYSSRGSAKEIKFIKDSYTYSFDQFDLQYNRPDIILKSFGVPNNQLISSYKRAYEKRLAIMGFSKEKIHQYTTGKFAESITPPQVFLNTEQQYSNRTKNPYYTIKVKCHDPNGLPIDRIHINVNGVPVNGIIQSKHDFQDTLKTNIKIELSPGENLIGISVLNTEGVSSLEEEFLVNYTTNQNKPDLYLAAIGISEYDNPTKNLKYADKDAKDIIDKYKKSNRFKKIHTVSILNSEAKKEKIFSLKDFYKKSKPGDLSILFYSGHGGVLSDKTDNYLSTNRWDETISYEEFSSILADIPSRQKLILIDACNSGEIDLADLNTSETVNTTELDKSDIFNYKGELYKSTTKSDFALMKELFVDLRVNSGEVSISSSGGGEASVEHSGNGVFTAAVLEAFNFKNGSDLNGDGNITINELQAYISKRVPQLSNHKQNPTYRVENVKNDFILWRKSKL